jgi:hypothetical protein
MRVFAAVVSGIAMGVLVLGPIAHTRAQQSRALRTVPIPASPRIETPAEPVLTVPEPAVQVTDELVTPRIVRTPNAQQGTPRPRVEQRRKPAPTHRSLFARLFLGNGTSHPSPFPRPRS